MTGTRLKREDFRRSKHDSAFSQWKILIGASDWEDHSLAKQGAEKYRTQNLPNWISCPGVYELGVAASRTRRLDSSFVVPVYLGQADNLRIRLQQYGRDGNHLENGCSSSISWGRSDKGPGLFKNIFSRGLPIVYRCAPMTSKKDAQITEKQLLDEFDYAWNKGSNGTRREDDIFKKLDRLSNASQFSLLAKKILFFNQKQVGIKIRACEPCSSKNESDLNDMGFNISFSRIFGVRKFQYRPEQYGYVEYCGDICGVAIAHGSVCNEPPVKGRKRCAKHKGLRINGCISKLNKEDKIPPTATNMGADWEDQKLRDSNREKHCGYTYEESPTNEMIALTCGFILDDGSPCERKPFGKNKRCLEHKGRRIRKCQPSFAREDTEETHYS